MAEFTFPRNEIRIRSIKLALADVSNIYERLARLLSEQAEIEISRTRKFADQTDEQFDAWKKNVRKEAFKITVTVFGREGESLFGDDVKVFQSPILPNKIQSIYATNITAYRGVARSAPVNSFELTLDFSKPPLLDANNLASSPTPNFSQLIVQGDRDGWVASVTEAVIGVTRANKTPRGWIHKAFVYDLGLFAIGMPAAIFVCWRFSDFINFYVGAAHAVVSGAAYIYIVLSVLMVYRALFGYAKWAFPTMELTNNHDSAMTHRGVLATILLAIIGNFIYDILW
jgi:hypothetical protein